MTWRELREELNKKCLDNQEIYIAHCDRCYDPKPIQVFVNDDKKVIIVHKED